MTNQLPINQVLAVIYGYSWPELKGGVNKVVVVVNPADARVRVKTWKNWIFVGHSFVRNRALHNRPLPHSL